MEKKKFSNINKIFFNLMMFIPVKKIVKHNKIEMRPND